MDGLKIFNKNLSFISVSKEVFSSGVAKKEDIKGRVYHH
jgi:hypothetical protein